MKNLTTTIVLALILMVSSCANIKKFPVSSVVPAANIAYRTQHDRNGNTQVKITAKNMASPDRLNPPQKMYIVWVTSENQGARNIGQLTNKNAKLAEMVTIIPVKFSEIFITAEDKADISYPSGVEISRIKL